MTVRHVAMIRLIAGAVLFATAAVGVNAQPYPAPYYPPPGYNPYYPVGSRAGNTLSGAANVINAQGQLSNQYEQARIMRQQAEQEKLNTQKQAFDLKMYEKANTPYFTEDQAKDNAMMLRRVMTNPMPAEITSGKAMNLMLPYLNGLAAQGVMGPPVPLNPVLLRQVNVSGGGGQSMGMLKPGGKLFWPMSLRGPKQKELDKVLNAAVAAVVAGDLDPALYNKAKKGTADMMQELKTKFHKEQIDGGEYLEGKRFMDSLTTSVETLARPEAVNYFSGAYTAQGRDVPEMLGNMFQKGLTFAPMSPGGDAAYRSVYDAMIAYAAGAQQSPSFRVGSAP